ncbi:DNA-binding protein [Prunus dulcis]|uniref:nucleoside-diphosphate kinase n=1 Tax=Prunus dulcis TaxID=3755 RepID=A0A4Y1RWL3_PRUDU|nr:DNA-binding protein [Prunus dulcis]
MIFINMDRPFAEKHYEDLSAKPFFSGLVDYIISGPVVAMIWEGKTVILTGRKIIGATNPAESALGTIRGDYAIEIGRNTIVQSVQEFYESSAHVKEDNFNIANKSKLKGSRPIPGVEHAAFKTSKLGKLGEGVHQSNSGLQKGKQKLSFKIYNEAQTNCYANDNEKIAMTL